MALAVAGPPPVSRNEVCETCYRECAVNCFVGTCGLEYPMGVYRFMQSNQCYSCDAVTANNVPGADRFEMCSSEQARAPPPITFSLTMDEATKEASMHRMAAQIRAAQSLATSDAAQQAWKTAADRYNSLLPRLRAYEMQVADAKQAMDHAANLAANAKGQYFDDTRALQAAVQAQTAAAIAAANKAQAEADKQGGANTDMAEYRRLLIAQDEAAKQYQAAAEAALRAMPTEAPKPQGLDSGLNANAGSTLPPCSNQTLLMGLRQAQSGRWQGALAIGASGAHQPALPPLDAPLDGTDIPTSQQQQQQQQLPPLPQRLPPLQPAAPPTDMAVAFLQPVGHRKVVA